MLLRTHLATWLCWLASWIQPEAEIHIRVVRRGVALSPVARRPRKRQRRIYTGRDSGTRARILEVLAVRGPLTRREIDSYLDVKTASIHLPRMVEDRLLKVVHLHGIGPRPTNQYHLVTKSEAVSTEVA